MQRAGSGWYLPFFSDLPSFLLYSLRDPYFLLSYFVLPYFLQVPQPLRQRKEDHRHVSFLRADHGDHPEPESSTHRAWYEQGRPAFCRLLSVKHGFYTYMGEHICYSLCRFTSVQIYYSPWFCDRIGVPRSAPAVPGAATSHGVIERCMRGGVSDVMAK